MGRMQIGVKMGVTAKQKRSEEDDGGAAACCSTVGVGEGLELQMPPSLPSHSTQHQG